MSLTPTVHQMTGYIDRYAAALYIGGSGHPPRNGLSFRQSYVGRVLSEERFHVLKPDRICSLSEFAGFVMVSRSWRHLTDIERTLLIRIYSDSVLRLTRLTTKWSEEQCQEATCRLIQAGYVRWAEPDVIELTLVGEAEVRHQVHNRNAGAGIMQSTGGIRVWHHNLQDHEIEMGRESTLSVTVDGMVVRIFTLKDSGAVVRVDHDLSHHVYTHSINRDRAFVQTYIDQSPARIHGAQASLEQKHE